MIDGEIEALQKEAIERDEAWYIFSTMVIQREKIIAATGITESQLKSVVKWLADWKSVEDPTFNEQRNKLIVL